MQTTPIKLPRWLQYAVGSLGGIGLFLVALLDSSILSFPVVTDLLVIEMTTRNPARMPYYAAMASVGSFAGCIWLYLLAKKGGEAYFHRHARSRTDHIRRWVDDHAFMSVFIPSLLPPPMPFKLFVVAEGVFQVPLRTFVFAVIAGRGLRYFAEGFLAVRYGRAVEAVLIGHKIVVLVSFGIVCVVIVVAGRLLAGRPPSAE